MKIQKYLQSSSKIILKKLCELSKDKNLIKYYEQYSRKLTVDDSVDETWSLISTALLLSENLWQNESAYKSIPNIAKDNILDALNDGTLAVKGDPQITTNCLLDENNNVANAINVDDLKETYDDENRETILYKIYKDKDLSVLDSCDRAAVLFMKNIFEGNVYGANQALLTDDIIDYRKFMLRVRHALAHSNYEILNNNLIRLYHFNRDSKKIDFNVALNQKIVITILDELNEFYYNSAKTFERTWNVFHNSYVRTDKVLDEQKVIQELLKYKMFNIDDCKEILETAKKNKYYNKLESVEKLNIIYNCFLNKIQPVCSYGIIANEILYGNNYGIIDSEYDEKIGLYRYLNSDFFGVNMEASSEEVDMHTIELYLFSFLNNVLLNNVNLNNNNILSIIDFSKMKIRDEDYECALNTKSKLEIDLNNRISKLKKDIENMDKIIQKKMSLYHNNIDKDIDYFKNKLPDEILFHIRLKSDLIIGLNNAYQNLQTLDLIVLSNYIMNHLRNCLAHGYIKFVGDSDFNNISNAIIEFSDYDPSDKSKLTFRGQIKLNDLLDIIMSEQFIDNVLSIKEGATRHL